MQTRPYKHTEEDSLDHRTHTFISVTRLWFRKAPLASVWPLASPWYVEEESEPRIHYRAVTGSIGISDKTPSVWKFISIKADAEQGGWFIACDLLLCVCRSVFSVVCTQVWYLYVGVCACVRPAYRAGLSALCGLHQSAEITVTSDQTALGWAGVLLWSIIQQPGDWPTLTVSSLLSCTRHELHSGSA